LPAERLLEDQDKPFTQRRRLELGSLRQQQGLRHEAQLETAATLTRVLKITVARDYKQQQLVTIGLPGAQQAGDWTALQLGGICTRHMHLDRKEEGPGCRHTSCTANCGCCCGVQLLRFQCWREYGC
jgi:hypothetical protein